MTDEPRCVADTNVLISALLSAEGTSNQAVHTVLRYGVLLSSEAAFKELESSLHREKFDAYLRSGDRNDYLSLIRGGARFVDVTEQIEACRDPDGDKFLELGVSWRGRRDREWGRGPPRAALLPRDSNSLSGCISGK